MIEIYQMPAGAIHHETEHLYMESDGEKSAEAIAQEIKRFSTAPILAEFAKLSVSLNGENNLWDKAYFVETIF